MHWSILNLSLNLLWIPLFLAAPVWDFGRRGSMPQKPGTLCSCAAETFLVAVTCNVGHKSGDKTCGAVHPLMIAFSANTANLIMQWWPQWQDSMILRHFSEWHVELSQQTSFKVPVLSSSKLLLESDCRFPCKSHHRCLILTQILAQSGHLTKENTGFHHHRWWPLGNFYPGPA